MAVVIDGLKYTEDHEWVKVEGNKATIGITDYAQNALGSIVYVELPDVGASFGIGDTFAVIESVKAASDSYMPIGGTVTAVNDDVVAEPGLLNDSAYDNWMIEIELANAGELDKLMDAEAYRNFMGGE